MCGGVCGGRVVWAWGCRVGVANELCGMYDTPNLDLDVERIPGWGWMGGVLY